MAEVTAELIKEVREKTGLGLLKCKEALVKTAGDISKAIEELRKQGLQAAEKRMGREVGEGSIFQYLHAGGKVGVMVELACETDFVARTDDFKELGRNLCLQVAASSPRFLTKEEVPAAEVEKEKEIYRAQIKDKPPAIADKIAEGRMQKFYADVCLMNQGFVKDESQTIDALVRGTIAKLGENIKVRRFVRMELGK